MIVRQLRSVNGAVGRHANMRNQCLCHGVTSALLTPSVTLPRPDPTRPDLKYTSPKSLITFIQDLDKKPPVKLRARTLEVSC